MNVRQRERRRCQQLAPLSFLRLTSLSDERVITHLQLKMSALLAFSLAPLYFSIARSLSFYFCLSFSPIYEVPTFCLRFFLVFFFKQLFAVVVAFHFLLSPLLTFSSIFRLFHFVSNTFRVSLNSVLSEFYVSVFFLQLHPVVFPFLFICKDMDLESRLLQWDVGNLLV